MISQEEFHESRWTIGQIAKALGTSTNTLNTWVQRGLITGNRAKQATGLPTLYSTLAALEFAVILQLNKGGISAEYVSFAADAARLFSHTGSGPSGWVGEVVTTKTRNPGDVYDGPTLTWLVACPTNRKSTIVPTEELNDGIRRVNSGSSLVFVLCLNDLHYEVPRRLYDISVGLIR
jgi:hypothetical protein